MIAAEESPRLSWLEDGATRTARWRSEAGWPAPQRLQVADDQMPADQAYRLACEGTALVWRGDFHNARQLLQALARRIDRKPRKVRSAPLSTTPLTEADRFHRHRQAQGRRARVLGMLLVEVGGDGGIALRRAPDLRAACEQVWGPPTGEPCLVALRELLGLVGAHEWRKRGVPVPALGEEGRIHPHYGVFSPVRGEYLDLVARAPLPADRALAFDIGTGTGVIAAILARRGVARVIATDTNDRALACARDNLSRLGLQDRVQLQATDLFPSGQAPLVVCNPPWIPARATSALERAVYDPDAQMLRGFLCGLSAHLAPAGEGWLILSDLAEHLGLRTREALLSLIAQGGLTVRERLDIAPRHPKASDPDDPLAAARAREVTSLWRLVRAA
jgi:methylase of polypeptide subunit release factors